MIYYIIALAVIVIDQFTKYLVKENMTVGQSIPLIPDVFHLLSHRNVGAAFGILPNQRWLFVVITIAVVIGIMVSLARIGKTQPRVSVGLALVLGGAIGNFIDRVSTGQVVDFLYIKLINFPIFNVADMAITFGVILLLIDILFDSRRKRA